MKKVKQSASAKTDKKKQRGIEFSTPFHCLTPVQIRYTDLDLHGHVNNSIYFNFFDLGKVDYFSRVKKGDAISDTTSVVIANMQINFFQPTRYIDNVAVETQILRLGNKSFTMLQQLVNAETHELKCQCVTTLVNLDTKTHQTATISQYWRDAIARFEGRGELAVMP